MHTTRVASGGRYPVLRTVAILFMLGAVVAIVGGIYGVVRAFGMINVWDRVTWAGVAISAAFFGALTSVAIAELIKLMIDMEHNTRVAAQQAMGASSAAVATPAPAPAVTGAPAMTATAAGTDGQTGGRAGQWLEGEETAEGALLRGH